MKLDIRLTTLRLALAAGLIGGLSMTAATLRADDDSVAKASQGTNSPTTTQGDDADKKACKKEKRAKKDKKAKQDAANAAATPTPSPSTNAPTQ